MKRLGTLLLTVLLLLSAQGAFAEPVEAYWNDDEAEVYYVYADAVRATLSVSSSGTATCKAQLAARDTSHRCEVTVSLKKKSSSGAWTTIAGPWTGSGKGATGASVDATKSGLGAGTYKVFVTGVVKDASGSVLERPSKNSAERQYQG